MEHYWKRRSWIKNCLVVSTFVLTAVASISCGGDVKEGIRVANGITAEDLATYTRELADDSMLGRASGGEGEAPTLAYLQAAYERIGLRPMGDSSLPGSVPGSPPFFQRVDLVGITADPSTAGLSFKGSAQAEAVELNYGSDFVVWTPQTGATLDVSGELVFVGYGITAPEEGWNDYRGVDVTDKIVLVLVGDPPLEDQSRFGGKAMTYYGRWTYKIEEGARRGAAGVLIIHSAEAAGYGWNVVQSTWMGEQLNPPAHPDATPPVPLQGWVSRDAAGQILTSAGFNLDELAAAAAREGFVPIELGIVGAGHLDTAARPVTSYNVVGAVEGSDPNFSDEYIIFMAHWDHFGIGEPVDGDSIYNGAYDNAAGVASMLEVAEAWTLTRPAPRRSVLFIATTAEEAGLLGATHYVKNPLVPLEKTLAVINIDGVNVWGPTEDLSVTGLGQSTLDDDLTAVLAGQGRSVTPDSEPEKGYYFRADHFPFAQAGVPAVFPWSGERFVGKPEEFAQRVWEEYDANHYHQPSDEFDETWDFSGNAQDMEALLQVGLRVAASDTWPEWRPDSEFKAAREAMLRNEER